MAFRLNKSDLRILVQIVEHRVLTPTQLAVIQHKSKLVVRRRLGALENHGLIQASTRGFGRNRGRPERLVSLTEEGVRLLYGRGLLGESVWKDKVTAENLRCLDHQILANWFRIHLEHVQEVIQRLSVRFLSPDSPFLERDCDNLPIIFERVPAEGSAEKSVGFTPDGVFSITDKKRQKSLLFFLEVDMGTESIASPKRDPRDIRQKIINYQRYFRSGRYKRYEQMWNCKLNGFRLLFLAHAPARLAALCRLVQEMAPSDFVWLTDQQRMFEQGLTAEIWARGGRDEARPQSILGAEMACQAPALPVKP